MSPKERVLSAINHREPDRVPIAIGGSAQKFAEPVIIKLVEYFGIPKERLQYVFTGWCFTFFCEDLWDKLEIDTRYVYLNPREEFTVNIQREGRKYVNEWGLDLDFGAKTFESILALRRTPLKEASIADLESYPWPEPNIPESKKKEVQKRAKSYINRYAVVCYRPVMGGVFSMSRFLRGTEQFFMDLILDKDFANALLQKVTEVEKRYYDVLIEAVANHAQIIEIEDDLGTQQAPMISPDTYRELIKPRHAELINFIKARQPNAKVMIHTDGSIASLIPDFIEAGIDIINPVQTAAKGMDLKRLKADFGDSVVFQGGIDTQQVLRGKPEDVEREVKRVIDIMAPGGGYLLGPSHNFSEDVPIQNIITMIESAKKHR